MQTAIVVIIIAVSLVYLIRKFAGSLKAKKSSCSGCGKEE